MKRTIGKVAGALGIGLLLAAGGSAAQPVEPCVVTGEHGHSFGSVNGRNGYHLWQCLEGGEWYYVLYCGDAECPMPL